MRLIVSFYRTENYQFSEFEYEYFENLNLPANATSIFYQIESGKFFEFGSSEKYRTMVKKFTHSITLGSFFIVNLSPPVYRPLTRNYRDRIFDYGESLVGEQLHQRPDTNNAGSSIATSFRGNETERSLKAFHLSPLCT